MSITTINTLRPAPRRLFGTDGIRGRANGLITPELALMVAKRWARCSHAASTDTGSSSQEDTRLSGYMIETALVAGFTAVGMDVLLLGPMPTPAVAMLTRSMRADIGVMISASHNLYEDNGIKIFGPDGFKLSDAIERQIEALIEGDLTARLAPSRALGRAKRIESVHARYIEAVKRSLPRRISLEGLRVVVDCANGAAYRVAPEMLWSSGPKSSPSGSIRTASTSTRAWARPPPTRLCARCARCARISGSPSTGTPTGCWWWTSAARWWTATGSSGSWRASFTRRQG